MRLLQCAAVLVSLMSADSITANDACITDLDNQSLRQLQQQAMSANADAQYEMGRQFEYGLCVDQNDTLAISWYEKAAANNSADANYRLGVLCDNGWGTGEDDVKAAQYYTASAAQNHSMAQHDLVGRPESSSTFFFAAAVMAALKKLDVGPLCLRFFALP